MADEIFQGPLQIVTGQIRFTPTGTLFAGPTADGTAGQALITDASANLTFGSFAAKLADPGYDGIRGWDDTDNAESFFHIGSGLTYTHATHTLSASGGGTGDFVGPSSSTDNAIVRFDGTTGKLGQNSAITIADTTGAMLASGAVSGGNMLSFTNSSTGASSTGGYFAASGATGATFALVGQSGSSDNAAYGAYFGRGSSLNVGLCAMGLDIGEIAAPDAPPTSFGRVYFKATDSRMYYKTDGGTEYGPLDSGTGTVSTGTAGRLALYPATATAVDDVYVQNTKNIDILIEAQGSRSANLELTIPNPGNAVTAQKFVLGTLTSGRVPFAGSGNVLTDDPGLTFAGAALTLGISGSSTGILNFNGGISGQASVLVAGAAGTPTIYLPTVNFDMSSLTLPASTVPLTISSAGVVGKQASASVLGPSSSTDQAIAFFDGTTGKLLKQSATPWVFGATDILKADTGTSEVFLTPGGQIYALPASSATLVLNTSAYADSNNRFALAASGAMNWGTGSGATDTTLSRAGTANLSLNGKLTAGGGFECTESGSTLLSAASTGIFYAKTDHKPYFNANAGTEFQLATTAALVLPSVMQPVHVSESATAGNLTTNNSYSLYIGRTTKLISNLTVLAKVTTAGIAVTGGAGGASVKAVLCSGACPVNAAASLTAIASVTKTGLQWTAGTQQAAFTGLSIAAGTDLWLVLYNKHQGGQVTPWAFDQTNTDTYQTGVMQGPDASDASAWSAQTTTLAGTTATNPYMIAMNIS